VLRTGTGDDRRSSSGVAEREDRARFLVVALDVSEDEAGIELERVGPRGHQTELAPLARFLEHERCSARDRIRMIDGQRDEPLVQAAVGVDLGDDLLSHVAALVEREGGIEAGFLRVDVVVDVESPQSGALLDAQAIARRESGRRGTGPLERFPQRHRALRARIHAEAGGAGEG
jgi:hypothetical protein